MQTQKHDGTTKDVLPIQVNEATGSLLPVDRTLFLVMMKYFVENGLMDNFERHLEESGCFDIVTDVTFVNHMKRFLASTGRTDETARMWTAARLDHGLSDGPVRVRSPMGVRG